MTDLMGRILKQQSEHECKHFLRTEAGPNGFKNNHDPEIMQKILDLLEAGPSYRVDPPFHDYSKRLVAKRDYESAHRIAQHLYAHHQFDIVKQAFELLATSEHNPITDGRLEGETESSMNLLIPKYHLVDIDLREKPKVMDALAFIATFRSYEKSFTGVEYALTVGIRAKEIPYFEYHIMSLGTGFITISDGK